MSYCRRYILLRNNGHSQLLLNQNFIIPKINKYHWLLIVFAIILVGCSTKTVGPPGNRQFGIPVSGNNPILVLKNTFKFTAIINMSKPVWIEQQTADIFTTFIGFFININCLRNLHICQYWNRVLTQELIPEVLEACGNSQNQPQKIMACA